MKCLWISPYIKKPPLPSEIADCVPVRGLFGCFYQKCFKSLPAGKVHLVVMNCSVIFVAWCAGGSNWQQETFPTTLQINIRLQKKVFNFGL